LRESNELADAIWKARAKVVVFLATVVVAVVIAGAFMYEIEYVHGGNEKFESIPESIYWAIVTMTTVGYGDIVPTTTLGRIITAMLILLGYSLIIVPTGFVSAEVISRKTNLINNDLTCDACHYRGHDTNAKFCKICGEPLKLNQTIDD
jgi:voltage-gated potassium channel